MHGTEHRLISPYHPGASGAVEWSNQTVLNVIRKNVAARKEDWYNLLSHVQFSINSNVSPIHNSNPFSLMFGRQSNGFQDYSTSRSDPLSPSELIKRHQWMKESVFPAILEKTKASKEPIKKSVNNQTKLAEIPLTPGTVVHVRDPKRENYRLVMLVPSKLSNKTVMVRRSCKINWEKPCKDQCPLINWRSPRKIISRIKHLSGEP